VVQRQQDVDLPDRRLREAVLELLQLYFLERVDAARALLSRTEYDAVRAL